MDHVHRSSPFLRLNLKVSAAGRAGESKSDARAHSTNPRFLWKPSATMLTYRLTGTRLKRGRPRRTVPHTVISPPQQVTIAGSSPITVRPAGAELLTWLRAFRWGGEVDLTGDGRLLFVCLESGGDGLVEGQRGALVPGCLEFLVAEFLAGALGAFLVQSV